MSAGHTLAPLPGSGWDWLLVAWGAPDQRRTEHCSYCGAALDHEAEIPLILTTNAGWVAEFCEACQSKYWGIEGGD